MFTTILPLASFSLWLAPPTEQPTTAWQALDWITSLEAGWPFLVLIGVCGIGYHYVLIDVGERVSSWQARLTAILGLLIPASFALRRLIRRRRGLCPKCGYPMGEAAVCSECGRTLPGRAAT